MRFNTDLSNWANIESINNLERFNLLSGSQRGKFVTAGFGMARWILVLFHGTKPETVAFFVVELTLTAGVDFAGVAGVFFGEIAADFGLVFGLCILVLVGALRS